MVLHDQPLQVVHPQALLLLVLGLQEQALMKPGEEERAPRSAVRRLPEPRAAVWGWSGPTP